MDKKMLNRKVSIVCTDDRIEKYGCFIILISKKHCRATMKNLLANGRGG